MKDGKKLFIMCDTFWTALYNPTVGEWTDYLDYRKLQNYNAVQFNALIQWDGGKPDSGYYPFEVNQDGTYNYYKFNEAYFERARGLVGIAYDKGFIPIMLVLHASYTKGTWSTKNHPEFIIPYEQVKPLAKKIAATFKEFNPMYVPSADTDINSEDSIKYAWAALEGVKEEDPDGLCSFHLVPSADIPEDFLNSKLFDWYCPQLGHGYKDVDTGYKLIEKYYDMHIKRPILNDEFFYEAYRHDWTKYGRFDEFDQRRTMWECVLAGAVGGIGYGASGVWNWYRRGKESVDRNRFGTQLTAHSSMRMEGSWEGPFVRFMVETFDLYDLIPCRGMCHADEMGKQELRMAKTADGSKMLVYMPYAIPITIEGDYSGYKFTLIELKNKRFGSPFVHFEDGKTKVEMYDINADTLLLAEKE